MQQIEDIHIGDEVRFLDSVGGGKVSRIDTKSQLVYVEDEDGFELPTPLSQIVPIATGEPAHIASARSTHRALARYSSHRNAELTTKCVSARYAREHPQQGQENCLYPRPRRGYPKECHCLRTQSRLPRLPISGCLVRTVWLWGNDGNDSINRAGTASAQSIAKNKVLQSAKVLRQRKVLR